MRNIRIGPHQYFQAVSTEFCYCSGTPELTIPGADTDYFSHEQVELWGVGAEGRMTGQEQLAETPHNPQTEYYRVGSQFLGENIPVFKKLIPPNVRGSQLFEFSIPIYLKNRLHEETLDSYRDRFLAGECPTALAISVLDIKGPGDWEGTPKITEHWCLAHYLLDGHHKMYAAASVHKPLTVLSFMDMSKSIATEKAVDYLFDRMS